MTLDPRSPFAPFAPAREHHGVLVPRVPPPRMSHIHVNFCDTCHYVWKAPAAAVDCLNCSNKGTARSLVEYDTEAIVM